MEEEAILNEDGLLPKISSLLRDLSVTYPIDSLLDSKMNFQALKSNGQLTKQKSAKAYNRPNNLQSAAVILRVAIHYRRVERNKTKCQEKLYQRRGLKTS